MNASPINMGTVDRVIRTILGLVAMWIVFYVPMSIAWLWVITIVGIVLIVTGLSGYCPAYIWLKMDTSGQKK